MEFWSLDNSSIKREEKSIGEANSWMIMKSTTGKANRTERDMARWPVFHNSNVYTPKLLNY